MPEPQFLSANQRQSLLWLLLGAATLWLIVELRTILTPFVIGAILAYVIEPAVRWLAAKLDRRETSSWARPVAVMTMVFLLGVSGVALILILVPLFQHEVTELTTHLPQVLVKANELLAPKLKSWFDINIQFDVATIKAWLTEQLQSADGVGSKIASSLKLGGVALAGFLGNLLMIPVVLIYLSMDWPRLVKTVDVVIPRRFHRLVTSATREIDDVLSQFLRGQITVMLCLAVYYSTALWLAGLDFALPIGMMTGLLVFIPYVGFGLGVLLAVLVGILQVVGGTLGLPGVAGIVAAFVIGQVIEGFVLTPKLVGERVGLHPLAIIFALLAFGQLFGFFGVLVAVPASAILLIVLRRVSVAYFASDFYKSKK